MEITKKKGEAWELGPSPMRERRVALLLRIRQELKEKLADLAKREHRSLNQQIEFLLEHALSDTVSKQGDEQQARRGSHG